VGSVLLPKVLGQYERELHPAIERALCRVAKRVAVVGCAEGYYAVGFARRLPESHIFAFDSDLLAQTLCLALARANSSESRVTVAGACQASDLQAVLRAGDLVFCDVDGFEVELLNPEKAPVLLECDLLVELHEPLRAGSAQTVLERFRASHEVSIIDAQPRRASNFPQFAFLGTPDVEFALDKRRPTGQQYAELQRKISSSSTQAPS